MTQVDTRTPPAPTKKQRGSTSPAPAKQPQIDLLPAYKVFVRSLLRRQKQ